MEHSTVDIMGMLDILGLTSVDLGGNGLGITVYLSFDLTEISRLCRDDIYFRVQPREEDSCLSTELRLLELHLLELQICWICLYIPVGSWENHHPEPQKR